MPLPQDVPLPTSLPVSLQAYWPGTQTSVPVWHGLAGVQAAPVKQLTQLPLTQARPEPQTVASATGVQSLLVFDGSHASQELEGLIAPLA